jgi:hypothetical protein
LKRRDFVHVCAASIAGATVSTPTDAALATRSYPRAKLVDERRAPILLSSLRVGVNYVFDYPFAATPCFLLRLDRPTAGGVQLKTEGGDKYQ